MCCPLVKLNEDDTGDACRIPQTVWSTEDPMTIVNLIVLQWY